MINWTVYCQYVILALFIHICLTEAVVSTYFPSSRALSRLEVIKNYFKQGFLYQDIVCLLLIRHGFVISLRQLKRVLKRSNLRRRQETYTPIEEVTQVIRAECENSGESIGY